MKRMSHYDSELQIFAEPPRDPTIAHLSFLRWLADHGRLEHETMGAPAGEYIADLDDLLVTGWRKEGSGPTASDWSSR
jgi:hypothetical protein